MRRGLIGCDTRLVASTSFLKRYDERDPHRKYILRPAWASGIYPADPTSAVLRNFPAPELLRTPRLAGDISDEGKLMYERYPMLYPTPTKVKEFGVFVEYFWTGPSKNRAQEKSQKLKIRFQSANGVRKGTIFDFFKWMRSQTNSETVEPKNYKRETNNLKIIGIITEHTITRQN